MNNSVKMHIMLLMMWMNVFYISYNLENNQSPGKFYGRKGEKKIFMAGIVSTDVRWVWKQNEIKANLYTIMRYKK